MRTAQVLILLLVTVGSSVAFSNVQNEPKDATGANSGNESSQASAGSYPKDIYPDSRNRLPLVKRENLSDAAKKIFDDEASNPNRLAGLQGPGGIKLWSSNPTGGSDYLRFHNPVGRKLSELCILVTARGMNSAFEWNAHEPEARRQGIEPEIIDIVRYRRPTTGIGDKEAVIIQMGRELFGTQKLSSETYARAVKLFGPSSVVDMVLLMGNYAGTSLLLAAFDQQLPPGEHSNLPLP